MAQDEKGSAMNPDIYMPFYSPEFWQAVEGQEDKVIVAYLRAITFYWHHNHCAGLQNKSEYLRKICRIDKSDWSDIQEIIFDNCHFFTLDAESDLWHQNRARTEWMAAKEKLKRIHAASRKGVEARRKLGQLPPPGRKK